MKELFIAAHEELIERYLEKHPEATEAEAYDKTADRAYDRMTDNLADMADQLRQRARAASEVGPKRFPLTYCSQCGREFGPGNHGYSHCQDHQPFLPRY